MKLTACSLAILGVSVFVQPSFAQSKEPLVEFDMMTWQEVKQAIQSGKTTALVYNGGTEQRGPQNVNGGHTLIAREVGRSIALKLGNAILAPVLAYSPNNASATLPGTIGLTPELYSAINEQIAEQLIITGFKNIVLMGDHGGGQKELGELAKVLLKKKFLAPDFLFLSRTESGMCSLLHMLKARVATTAIVRQWMPQALTVLGTGGSPLRTAS